MAAFVPCGWSVSGGVRSAVAISPRRVSSVKRSRGAVIRGAEEGAQGKKESSKENNAESGKKESNNNEKGGGETTQRLVNLSDDEQKVKDEVMQQLKTEMSQAKKAPTTNRNYGQTRDADGKANIWAVEPKLALEDEKSAPNKLAIIGIGVAVLLVFLAILPKLPLVSPEAY